MSYSNLPFNKALWKLELKMIRYWTGNLSLFLIFAPPPPKKKKSRSDSFTVYGVPYNKIFACSCKMHVTMKLLITYNCLITFNCLFWQKKNFVGHRLICLNAYQQFTISFAALMPVVHLIAITTTSACFRHYFNKLRSSFACEMWWHFAA